MSTWLHSYSRLTPIDKFDNISTTPIIYDILNQMLIVIVIAIFISMQPKTNNNNNNYQKPSGRPRIAKILRNSCEPSLTTYACHSKLATHGHSIFWVVHDFTDLKCKQEVILNLGNSGKGK